MKTLPTNADRNASQLAISAIGTYKPPLVLPNAWYASTIRRKFVKHTGIVSRAIATEDEVSLATRAVSKLVAEKRVDLRDCAAVVFVSPSLLPMKVAHLYADHLQARAEQPNRVARRFCAELGLSPREVWGINGFCSGYAKALQLVKKRTQAIGLTGDEFILVVTSSRISRITDFACDQSGPLFGDFATATILSPTKSTKYPAHLNFVDARYEKQPASKPYFDFSRRRNVLAPTPDGGHICSPERIVFSLDGMGIADSAPRAMASAATQMAREVGIAPEDFQFVVPHQAGSAIVRLAGMKLEQAGFHGDLINGLTADVGNISSCSVPYALNKLWNQLKGNILCPVAAVGAPGKPEISQGCIILRAASRRHAQAA